MPTVKAVQMRKVRQLYAMLDGMGCRPAAVRRYFGEDGRRVLRPVRPVPQPAARASTPPKRRRRRCRRCIAWAAGFGRGRIVDHLLGKTKDAVGSPRRALSTWGIGRDISAAGWRDLIDQLLFEGLLREDPNDGRPLIGLGDADAGRAPSIAASARVACGSARGCRRRRAGRAARASATAASGSASRPADAPLFEALRAWRRDRAAEQHVPPYVIFHDATLSAIARERPGQLRGPGQGQRRRPEQAQALWRGCVESGAGKY